MSTPRSAVYYPTAMNTCCVPEMVDKFNLYKANPFDQRQILNQRNQWCSNELLLKDKNLRLLAGVQPLDLSLDTSVSNNVWPY